MLNSIQFEVLNIEVEKLNEYYIPISANIRLLGLIFSYILANFDEKTVVGYSQLLNFNCVIIISITKLEHHKDAKAKSY